MYDRDGVKAQGYDGLYSTFSPRASMRAFASLRAQVWMLQTMVSISQSDVVYTMHAPCIGFIVHQDHSQSHAAKHAPIPHRLPAFLLTLLARWRWLKSTTKVSLVSCNLQPLDTIRRTLTFSANSQPVGSL